MTQLARDVLGTGEAIPQIGIKTIADIVARAHSDRGKYAFDIGPFSVMVRINPETDEPRFFLVKTKEISAEVMEEMFFKKPEDHVNIPFNDHMAAVEAWNSEHSHTVMRQAGCPFLFVVQFEGLQPGGITCLPAHYTDAEAIASVELGAAMHDESEGGTQD